MILLPGVTQLLAPLQKAQSPPRAAGLGARRLLYLNLGLTPIAFSKPLSSVQFSSVTKSCLTLCDPMNRSTPGLPVHFQLPEFTQTHVHRVGDAIQPSHPLSSPSPPAPNPSQHQSLFQWVNSLHEVVKVLEFQLQALSKSISQRRQEAVNPLPQSKTPIVQIKQPQFLYHPPLVFI